MLYLLRNIRRKLLAENRVTRYLVYAIGEIFLVVIGILIALQINNWNSDNQQRKLEIKYLTEIKQNLEKDISDIDFNLAFNKSRLISNSNVLRYIKEEIEYTDSLEFHLGNLLFSTRTLANNSAYENLKFRGLEIISNDSLRQLITTLYEFHFHNAIDFETKDDHEFQYQVLFPEVIKALNITEFSLASGTPIGLAKPITDPLSLRLNYTFKNAIILNLTYREGMVMYYQHLKENVQVCIKEIEQELNALK